MSKTLKEKFLAGEDIVQSRISMASTTEQVHQTIADTGCDIIYIDSQHGPYTEWDIARISEAGEGKTAKKKGYLYCWGLSILDMPIASEITAISALWRSKCLKSRPKKLSTKPLIHSTYPHRQKKLGRVGRIWHRGEKRPPRICQMVERERNPWIQGRVPQVSLEHTHTG